MIPRGHGMAVILSGVRPTVAATIDRLGPAVTRAPDFAAALARAKDLVAA